jgi:phosphodiesterase/alkaline phosphatase D-like protein
MLREGFHHIRGNALMALSFIRRSFPVGLGLFLVGALGLSGLPPTQQERAAHAGVAHAGREAAQSWYFLPYPARGQGWQTIVMLTNLGSRELRVNFAAYDEDGEFLGASTIRLAAQATRTLETGEVLPEGGTLKVEAKEHLWVGAIFRTRDGTKAEVLPALDDPSRQLDFPALLPGDLSGKTITLLNPDAASASLELIALDQTGAELSRTLLPSLPPMASHTFAVRDLFSGDILQQLSTVRVISDRGIVGLQLVDPPDGDLVGLPALTITSQEWSFPIATQGEAGELWTSVGLFNLGEVSTSVTVEAFDDANNSLGIIDGATLLPGATHFVLTANMGGIIPPQAASLKVIADQSISGYEVIGVKEGMGVTATLGIPEEDQIRVGFDLTGSKDGRVLTVSPLVRIGDGSIRSTGGTIGAGEWKEVVSVKPSGAVTEVIAQESNAALQTISTSGPVAGLSLIWPVPPNIGQDYAQYDWGKADEHHTGLDISGVKGKTTVRAAADGWIVKIQENDVGCGGKGKGCEDHGFGNTVIIKHQIGSTVVYTQYSHLDSIKESLKQACGPVDRGRKKRRTCKVPVEVKANDELGKVGCTLYGKSDCKMSNGPHLHFELKDFGTLTPAGDDKQLDDDDGFGYTFSHPDKVGYHDPILNLHQVSSIAEIRVRVTAAGQGTSIRVGPAGYRALRTAKKDEEFIAFRMSVATASPACSDGWYQIRPTDKSEEIMKVNSELYFKDLSRPGSAIPDAWICRGNAGQVWVKPISTPTTYTLTVTKLGTGSGTVTSNPAGINCGTDCSETYPSGTNVTLTATPSSGSIFSGWGADCSSCGASSTCTITMDKDKTCTATFNAVGAAPTATTGSATNITTNSATLTGTVNPNGLATTVYFQWGTSPSYGNSTPSQSIGSGTSTVNVSANLSGLLPNTTYYYRIVASNSAGTTYGSGMSFRTNAVGAAPTATTGSATNITTNSATLNGTVNPNGLATTVYFQWGTSPSYGNSTPSQSIGSGTSTVNVSANLSGLLPNTTYYYRIVASNSAGTTYGSGMSFRTNAVGAAPTATTGSATNITTNSATLNGTVNPNGLATTVYFQWGTSTSYGNSTPSQSIGSGTSTVNVSANLSGLLPNTTYYYRIVASNSAGTTYGSGMSFRTNSAGTAPTATTGSATNITTNSATLNGTVNPNGLATTVYFQWGTSPSYGNSTPSQSIGSGTSTVNVSANLSGLLPNTTYYYRIVASNSAGTTYGSGMSFRTNAVGAAPTATTGSATNITTNSATLNGTVNPNGLATTVYFQWGTSPSYGNSTPSQSIGSGTSTVNVSANLSGLLPNTTYYYRIVASNSAGTTYGSGMSFRTNAVGAAPTATTGSATNITTNSATLNGTVNPNGLATTVYFQWGTSPSYGNSTPSQSIGSGTSTVNVSANLSGLLPNTTYYYRIVASNSAGTTYGSGMSFRTNSLPPATNRLLNPSFESGSAYWVQYSSTGYNIITNSTAARARTGSWYAWFGAANNVSEYIYQDVTIPANATVANVEFWYQVATDETSTSTCYDKLVVEVRRPSDNALLRTLTMLCNYHKTNIWTRSGPFSVLDFRGQTIRLRFYCTTDGSLPTSFFVDDVALIADGN